MQQEDKKKPYPGYEHEIEAKDLLSGCFLSIVLIVLLIILLIFGGYY